MCGESCARNPPKYSRVSTRINIYENPPVFICARQLVLRRCSVNVNKYTASKLVTLTFEHGRREPSASSSSSAAGPGQGGGVLAASARALVRAGGVYLCGEAGYGAV
jgi:hypothetical protein